jgi:hypothetical protein
MHIFPFLFAQGYSFPVTKLNALLLTLFERYAQLLRVRFSKDFQKAVQETEHQPMEVQNADELRKVLNVCWLKTGDAERLQRCVLLTDLMSLMLPCSL